MRSLVTMKEQQKLTAQVRQYIDMVNGLYFHSGLSSQEDSEALYTTFTHFPIHSLMVVNDTVATAALWQTDPTLGPNTPFSGDTGWTMLMSS